MRIVDSLVQNFPHLIAFDPYQIFPGGNYLDRIHFYDWLLAGIIWVAGLGSPSEHLIDTVSAYFPAVLGALTVIPVFFIGKALFNRWVGLLAAALTAVLPGEFLGRSLLGFTDHHVAETLFTTTLMLFLILAVKAAKDKRLALDHVIRHDWAALRLPLLHSFLAGLWLGIYLITWGGSLLFVFLIAVYFGIQLIIDHLRHGSTSALWMIGLPMFVTTRLIMIPFSNTTFDNVGLFGSVLILLVAGGLSRLMSSRKLAVGYYPLALAGIGLAGLLVFRLINPGLFSSVLEQFTMFHPSGSSSTTTLEMQGMFFPNGIFSFVIAWGNYNLSLFAAGIALVLLACFAAVRDRADRNLLVVWSLIIFLATFGQRRFGYYLAVNVALLAAPTYWEIIWRAGLRKLMTRPASPPPGPRARPKARKPRRATSARYTVFAGMAGIVVLFSMLFWNIPDAVEIGTQTSFAPSDAWCSTLAWMKTSTPEPFGDANFYYRNYDGDFKYPQSAYGVAAWWDYGYWITRMAHRVPSANPGQSPEPIKKVTRLFLSQDETAAEEEMRQLRASYIIIDQKTVTSIYWAILVWAGKAQDQYSDIYYTAPADKPQDSRLQAVRLFYPEYYHSLAVRLYNFDTKPVTNPTPIVVTYKENVSPEGVRFKQIINARGFQTYADAQTYAESQKGNARIVSNNPFVSPVPLEALKDYRLAYASSGGVQISANATVPEVKVFQYLK